LKKKKGESPLKPILSVVGKSNSGKTTLLEKLIPELKRRGYKVAVVKHDLHGFEMDQEGKDTWRLTCAGADEVIISSPVKIALLKNVEKEMPLDEINRRYLDDVDIILTEGFKRENKLKIEVIRRSQGDDLLCSFEELMAVVSEDGTSPFDLTYKPDEIALLVDLIEKKLLKGAPE